MFLTNPKRAKHFTAMVLIGDGVMALLHPRTDARAWKRGPKFWRDMMRELANRPNLTRAIGLVQIAGGVIWALRQERDEAQS